MNKTTLCIGLGLAFGALAVAGTASAGTLYENNGRTLGLDVSSMIGAFSASEDYLGEGGKDWQEGYLKATLTGSVQQGSGGRLYGGLGFVAVGTFGQGDAGGYTTGSERRVSVDDAFIGWQSPSGVLDLSFGRQMFQLGDGFLIAGDAISLGKGLEPLGVKVNRGGGYYLAGRKSFGNTAIARIDPEGPLRGDVFWLQSNNRFHQDTELAGVNLEYVSDEWGTAAFSYMKVLDVDKGAGLGIWDQRKGMNVYSVRGQGNAGVDNLFLSAEYVAQRGGSTDVKNHAYAWYAEAGWTFADVAWSPTLNFRHARFSGEDPSSAKNKAFDPLFFGLTRGLGTWFQGEVASNYAGPANSGNKLNRLELMVQPREDLTIGLQYWQFDRLGKGPEVAGREVDLFAFWEINDNFIFSPLIGVYKPRGSDVRAAQGNSKRNVYLQAVLMYFY